ncbi:acetyltransferase [Streptomyces sp. SID8014]|uniref:peptidase C39 family protein n=1 Tax=Streptomyces sp. SID8014 TaxID=2706097 RepID=UPI0013B805E3|nr:peptidase C39 family protein [Streptomyces sp. SID8014]NEC14779.1 acetyltransferase [Streptomyces sp. SID8014]
MPPPRETTARSVVVPFQSDAPPAALAPLGGEVPERWRALDRSAHAPHLVAVPDDDGRWRAAALVTARPHTSYLKIVDAVGDVPAAVEAVVAHARHRGLAQVKWEGWRTHPEDAAAAGFTPLRPPPVADGAGPETGYVRWLAGATVTGPPYYGQTTHFTCGAVTALVAHAHRGTLPEAALGRRAELTLWRGATNFPVCEPVGLGVAVRRTWPGSPVRVHLDTDRPVLLDHLTEDEREWRADLQRVSRTEAAETGVPVDARPLSSDEIRRAVGRGEQVLLLVSLTAMQGWDVPHWVLVHGAVPGALVVDDPWAGADRGESWVDAHLLPVADAALEEMSAVSSDPFHGAVVLGRP